MKLGPMRCTGRSTIGRQLGSSNASLILLTSLLMEGFFHAAGEMAMYLRLKRQ